uniref:Uncharacterized protein n=1 Tax=Anguilla anguilla TaxID=7936 RepID=A0A0E9RJQ6_ANGAN
MANFWDSTFIWHGEISYPSTSVEQCLNCNLIISWICVRSMYFVQ